MWQDLASIDWGALGPIFAVLGMVFFLLGGKVIDSRTRRDVQYNDRIDNERKAVKDDYDKCREDLLALQNQMQHVMSDLTKKETEVMILEDRLEECERQCKNLQRIMDSQ